MSHARSAALVLVGGAVGTLGRHGVAESWAASSSVWPWPTFVVNIVGSLALGLVVVRMTRPDHDGRLLLGTGLLGGFTTYSAFAIETDRLFRDDRLVLAVLYPPITVTLGIVAAVAGMLLGRRQIA
ncbi:MAG: CrcB family protein [Aeromicrobium sp.]|uniref:fluoride efflux transporter FluC n=1 Tax=Aeromicrobium sp. TaxID=1871063 RepID=UPI003C3A8D3E